MTSSDGGTILVRADQVTKLRMALAQDNLPAAGVGYEIFDKSDAFGTTAFVQNINQLRALEGELSRSIQTIDGIQSARVHLVIPDRQVFSATTRAPRPRWWCAPAPASIAARSAPSSIWSPLRFRPCRPSASPSSTMPAICWRAAMAAPSGAATAAEHDQHVNDYEERLRSRIESLVSSVVGIGHVRAQVTAEMKFDHTSTTSEAFDPESRVVRSSQTVERNATDTSGGATAVSVANALPGGGQTGGAGNDRSSSGSTEETTNYEINKTVTTSTNDGGTVKRLSVAVVVDGAGDGSKARTPAEMSQIEALVKSAMGFDTARGDQLNVRNMPFARMDAGSAEPGGKAASGPGQRLLVQDHRGGDPLHHRPADRPLRGAPLIGRMFAAQNGAVNMITNFTGGSPVAGALPAPGMASAAAATAAALGGPAHAQGALPAPDGSPGAATLTAVPRASNIDLSQLDGQFGEKSIKKVGEVVSAHPEEALSIIRTWLHQPV